jgi:beta-glucosidase
MNGRLGTIFISTMQAKDSLGFMQVATTIKHYIYGSSTGGVNQASINGGVNMLYNSLALPYINVFKTV